MKIDNKKTIEILLKGSYISDEDAKLATEQLKKTKREALDYFISKELVTADLYGQAMAEFYKVNYSDLNSYMPPKDQVMRIPEVTAKKFRVVLFKDGDKKTIVATDDPSQKALKATVDKIFVGKKVEITYSLREDLDQVFTFYKKSLETRFEQIIKKQNKIAPEIIEEIVKDALNHKASDIHFEPQEKEVLIRFRVDGILYEAGRISKLYYENILNIYR